MKVRASATDWSLFESIFKCFGPALTVRDFTRLYFPDYAARTIGTQYQKFNIKPKKYFPTLEHKQRTADGTKIAISEEQRKFICDNATNMSRNAISRAVGLSYYIVCRVLKDKGVIIDQNLTKQFHTEASRRHVAKATAASVARWSDPEFRVTQSKLIGKQSKILWQNELYRLKVKNGIAEAHETTDLRSRLSTSSKHAYLTNQLVRDCLLTPRPHKNSKLNDRVAMVLEGLHIDYEREFELVNYHFDFKIGQILLEVNGDYWHKLPHNQKNDLAKSTIIHKYFPEYELKTIWESEFNSVNGSKRLTEILGIQPIESTPISLSEVIFTTGLDRMTTNKFLTQYHYLGSTNRCKIVCSLMYGLIPIAIAVFGQPVRQNIASGKVLELIRLCRYPYVNNKNLLSYLISKSIRYIKSLLKYDNLVSFADLRFHNGAVYKASNWIDCGETASDYEYRSINNIPIHKKTLYNRAVQANLTERQYAEQNNYQKVSVGTKRKFIYRLV